MATVVLNSRSRNPVMIERLCRAACDVQGIDPDGIGWAITKQTLERLGPSYKLWEYQIPLVERIAKELECQ
jgi:hypothetical protein